MTRGILDHQSTWRTAEDARHRMYTTTDGEQTAIYICRCSCEAIKVITSTPTGESRRKKGSNRAGSVDHEKQKKTEGKTNDAILDTIQDLLMYKYQHTRVHYGQQGRHEHDNYRTPTNPGACKYKPRNSKNKERRNEKQTVFMTEHLSEFRHAKRE